MRAVYVSASQDDQARANTLGLGLIVTPGTVTPFALLQGAGLSFTLPEPINTTTLQADMATILNAEAANDAAAATAQANADTLTARATTALTNNVAYLGIASPTTAQAVTQVAALTRQVDALIRLAVRALDTTAGT